MRRGPSVCPPGEEEVVVVRKKGASTVECRGVEACV